MALSECVAEGVRRERAARRMTQAEVAERVGMSRGALADLERGERTISVGTVERLCVALGCTLADLLPGERGAIARERFGINGNGS